jgi:3-methyladenine DNA glycosylase Tag
MTKADINAESIAALLEKITQGEWKRDPYDRATRQIIAVGNEVVVYHQEHPRQIDNRNRVISNFEFIAAAPDIARAYLELSKENERLENEIVEMLAGEDI